MSFSGALIPNNAQGQVVTVNRVYKERARSDARRKPEPVCWSQTIQRYSGAAGNVTFVDMDRTSNTLLSIRLSTVLTIHFGKPTNLTKLAVYFAKYQHPR